MMVGLCSLGESITYTTNSFNSVGNFTEFFAKPANVRIHGARVHIAFVTPNIGEQRIASLNAPPAFEQHHQKFEFGRGQINLFSFNGCFVFGEVNDEIVMFQNLKSTFKDHFIKR